MRAGADRPLLQALASLVGGLQELGAPFMLIGGLAVIARGIARATRDIEATC